MMTTTGNQSTAYLVLGASGGIGSALARTLADRGHNVAVAGRTETKVHSLASDLGAYPLVFDATDPEAVERGVAEARAHFGGLHGIANCVGSVLLKPAHLTSPDEWHETLATNLGSAFAVVRAAGRALRDDGGSVVLIATAASRLGLANHEAIAAAKGGVMALARSAAATYASAGIRFNVVAPGLVRTEATRRIWDNPAGAKASLGMHPLGRFGEPDDVARAVAWLLEPDQGWITGQVLGVDGGLADLKLR
jgi:3-oxoacyl-[acyl-carrier protein] reductase